MVRSPKTGRGLRSWRPAVVVLTGIVVFLAGAVMGDLATGLGAGTQIRPSHLGQVTVSARPLAVPPGRPTGVVTEPGHRSLVVSWQPPVDAGSAPIDGYEAVAQPGRGSCSAVAPATTCTITGLNNGQFFTVTVRAFSAAGVGEASDPSAPVRP